MLAYCMKKLRRRKYACLLHVKNLGEGNMLAYCMKKLRRRKYVCLLHEKNLGEGNMFAYCLKNLGEENMFVYCMKKAQKKRTVSSKLKKRLLYCMKQTQEKLICLLMQNTFSSGFSQCLMKFIDFVC